MSGTLFSNIEVFLTSQCTQRKLNMKTLPGILIGLAAGVVVGVLMAPESGRKTRKKITNETDSFFKSLQSQLQDGLDSIRNQYNEYVDQAADSTKSAANDAKRRAKY
jgi:gas vesicle protein